MLWSCLVLMLPGCRPPLGDDLPRPVGIGRTSEGQFRFVVPLCDGESVFSFEVEDHQSERPIWKVSQPIQDQERSGVIVLGDARGFAKQETPMQEPLPRNVSVVARLTNGLHVSSGFLLEEVPATLSSAGHVLNSSSQSVSEDEFRRQVESDYC